MGETEKSRKLIMSKQLLLIPYVLQLCDRFKYPIVVSLSGNFIMATAFFFLGPAPFLPIAPNVPMTFAFVSLVGIGYACVMVSTFTRAHRAAMKKGYNDDIDTYLIISGMYIHLRK